VVRHPAKTYKNKETCLVKYTSDIVNTNEARMKLQNLNCRFPVKKACLLWQASIDILNAKEGTKKFRLKDKSWRLMQIVDDLQYNRETVFLCTL